MKLLKFGILILILFFFATCSRYNYTVTPFKLPEAAKNKVIFFNNIYVSAKIIKDSKKVGFDIKGAKVLPVMLGIDNKGDKPATILPSQCFIIDYNNNAWPILKTEQLAERVKNKVIVGQTVSGAKNPAILGALLGAVGGFAVAIATDKSVGESVGKGAAIGAAAGAVYGAAEKYPQVKNKISEDLENKSIDLKTILPNQLSYGFLYFPGEIKSIKELRIALQVGNKIEVKTIHF